ncbi:hypothetical protein [Mesorhizobium sp. CN2-181]|uniref:hypothetical protein n=1 Tax=Mesorhizobium yinganensis TaxID=3157707 RepID=UPI0032B7FC20
MNAINIRIEDAKLVRKLFSLANEHGRSVETEALSILASVLAAEPEFDRLAVARRISAMTPKDHIQTDSTLLLREDRDRDE